MTRLTLVGALASGVLAVALSGCGGAATPTPAGSAVAVLPSQAASSAVEPSAAEPSAAESSGAEPSAAASSGAEQTFTLPSEAKDLEALLPDTICGKKATKLSITGASFAQSGQSEFLDAIKAIGKTPADVTFAIGASEGCTAGILRIAGADPNQLQTAMLAAAAKSAEAPTQKSVGGKNVYVTAGTDDSTYVYFHGDAVIFATGKTESDAASILQGLP